MVEAAARRRLARWLTAAVVGASLGVSVATVLVGHPPAVLVPLGDERSVCRPDAAQGGRYLVDAVADAAAATIEPAARKDLATPASAPVETWLAERRCGAGLRIWNAPRTDRAREAWLADVRSVLRPDVFAGATVRLGHDEAERRRYLTRIAAAGILPRRVTSHDQLEDAAAVGRVEDTRTARVAAARLTGGAQLIPPDHGVVEVAAAGLGGAALAVALAALATRRSGRAP